MAIFTTAKICALLLAGAGSVVAVQQARPAIAKVKAKYKPAVHRAVAAPAREIPRVVTPACPSMAAPLGGGFAALGPMQGVDIPALGTPMQTPPSGIYFPGGGGIPYYPGGGGGGYTPVDPVPGPGPDPIPGVPAPANWAMMLTGFGLVGVSLRRRAAFGRVAA